MAADFTLNRRNFLAGMAGLAIGFQDKTLQKLEKLKPEEGAPDNEEFWLRVRSEFQINDSLITFNNVGLAPSPLRLIELQTKLIREANVDPSYIMWRKQDRELEEVRESLAQMVGCKANELALVPNATYGLQTAIGGLKMERGDEILTTSHDYPRAITAIKQRERREGVKLVEVLLPARPIQPEELANLIVSKVTDKTRLVCLCTVNYLNGQVVPIERIRKMLAGRNLVLMVDGAQSIGLMDDSFPRLTDHIYLACLHKWMMSPIATGIFVVREDMIRRVWPLHPAEADLDDKITKFEQIGTHAAAPMLAMKEGLQFHNWIGLSRKSARVEHLRSSILAQLQGAEGMKIYSSLDPKLGRAMLTVGFEKAPTAMLAGVLLEKHGIHVTSATRAGFDGIRISPSIMNTAKEVGLLTSILREIAKNGI
jgi:isopenicillin-N epimerase